MKLENICLRQAVPEPGGSANSAYYQANRGWEIETREGLVFIRKSGAGTRIVPMANVAYMTPVSEPAPAPPTKAR